MEPADFDCWPPVAGPFGAPIVSSTVSSRTDIDEHRYLPPGPPSRTVYDLDDDGEIINERELTEDEFRLATERYEAARAEYERTNGILLVEGPTTHEATVKCADGSSGRALGDGSRGRWVEWSTPAKG